MVSSPQDFANWAETAKITSVQFFPDSFWVDFDRRTGPDRWPDMPFGDGSLEYTLGHVHQHRTATGTVRPSSSSGSSAI